MSLLETKTKKENHSHDDDEVIASEKEYDDEVKASKTEGVLFKSSQNENKNWKK